MEDMFATQTPSCVDQCLQATFSLREGPAYRNGCAVDIESEAAELWEQEDGREGNVSRILQGENEGAQETRDCLCEDKDSSANTCRAMHMRDGYGYNHSSDLWNRDLHVCDRSAGSIEVEDKQKESRPGTSGEEEDISRERRRFQCDVHFRTEACSQTDGQ